MMRFSDRFINILFIASGVLLAVSGVIAIAAFNKTFLGLSVILSSVLSFVVLYERVCINERDEHIDRLMEYIRQEQDVFDIADKDTNSNSMKK